MPLPTLMLTAGDFCVMRAEVADKLLACRDGDGALLYLYLLRRGAEFEENEAMRALGFDKARYDRAVFTLTRLELAENPAAAPVKEREQSPAPLYKAAELRQARMGDLKFSAVCQSAESVLGRTLTEGQLRTLFIIYDHLGLPADVTIELLSYLKREKGTVTRRDIEQEAYLWADMGLFDSAAAGEFLKRRETEKPVMEAMLLALHMGARPPAPNEARYLSEIIRMGFPPEAVSLAYDRMTRTISKFSWRYLRGILTKWHEKNVHTVSEITALEPESRQKKTVAEQTYLSDTPSELEDWEKQWLAEKERNIRRRKEREASK